MPIDLVIDEREGGPVPKTEGLPGDTNNNANRSNADSTSHTDGASTPEVVSLIFTFDGCKAMHYISWPLNSQPDPPPPTPNCRVCTSTCFRCQILTIPLSPFSLEAFGVKTCMAIFLTGLKRQNSLITINLILRPITNR